MERAGWVFIISAVLTIILAAIEGTIVKKRRVLNGPDLSSNYKLGKVAFALLMSGGLVAASILHIYDIVMIFATQILVFDYAFNFFAANPIDYLNPRGTSSWDRFIKSMGWDSVTILVLKFVIFMAAMFNHLYQSYV